METRLLNDRQSRLRLDYQVAMLMRDPLMEIEAYRSVDDLRASENAITSVEEGHLATHYRVTYKIRTLIARDEYSPKTIVRFDLFADNNYPQSQPAAFVIDTPIPWSPHFDQLDELTPICIGDIWLDADGEMLLGDLFVHIAKLLNFDEPPYEDPSYIGFNEDAIKYWVEVLGRRPLANISYPVVEDIVRELIKPEPVIHPASKSFVRKHPTTPPAKTITLKPGVPIATKLPRRQITGRRIIIT